MKAKERWEKNIIKQRGSGRDEMNLAEFPIAALGKRPTGVKTLVFSDVIYDCNAKRQIPRTLTIAGTDAYGLPSSRDEEVVLGLIQLSAKQSF